MAVTLSGIAPLVLIAGRASIYADLALVKQWFTPVLVLHVNLSVGLWFLAMMVAIWRSYLTIPPAFVSAANAATWCFLAGILCIALAPLAGGTAYTSNYIPVQDNILFFAGLGFVCASLLLNAGIAILPQPERQSFAVFLCQIMALTLIVALGCFVFSVKQHPAGYGGEGFYEAVFWAGGHILQLLYVQVGMIAWLMLAERLGVAFKPQKLINAMFLLLWFTAVASIPIYWSADVNSYEHIVYFTWQMYFVTGPVPALLALWCVIKVPRMKWRENVPAAGCLVMSLCLFLFGGGLGFLIEGSNVTIPAHYHGSTVGVTLALMGVFYLILPYVGGVALEKNKLAAWQPWIYGVGQVMHVSGLAVAGGYNIARKTAGALDAADQAAAMALQIMRLGGLLAVAGGGLFVILAVHSLIKGASKRRNPD